MRHNRPLPSSKNPHIQNEARCSIFLVKMSFICMRMKNDFHIKGRASTLVLKQRPGGTRKWPIRPMQGNPDPGIGETFALESGIQVPLTEWKPASGFLNSLLGIQNPRLSWIPLYGATQLYFHLKRLRSYFK